MTDKELDYFTQRVLDLYEPIQQHYFELMGEHIKDIGKLTKTDVHRLEQIQRMNGNARLIAEEVAMASNKAVKEIEEIFDDIAKDYYAFSEKFYTAQGIVQVAYADNKALQRTVKAELEITKKTLLNLSNTTASQLKKNPTGYRQLIDKAVREISLGTTDYNTAIRSAVRRAANEGITYIDFDSGYKRRLDSQVRMNVLQGSRQMAINVAQETGKEYGADGVEVSSHGVCAPDHLDIQGRQFTTKEFEKANNRLDRKIGELNCKHITFPILIGYSKPLRTDKELDTIAKTSTKKIKIDGVTKTRYEWSQEQRQLETAIRKQKDVAVLASKSGDMTLRREAQSVINRNKTRYNYISKEAGLETQKERMSVSGFRQVKA